MSTIRVIRKKGKLGEALLDPAVPVFAKAVIATAAELANGGERDIRDLLMCFSEDEDKVYRAIMKLRTLGYCKRIKVDGVTQFKFLASVSSRVLKNKNSYSYSKNMTQTQGPPKQIREREYTQGDDEFDNWDNLDTKSTQDIEQPSLLPAQKSKPKTKAPTHDVIPAVAHHMLYRICFLAESENEVRLVSSRDRGRVTTALSHLRSGRADLSQINRFEDWWNKNWRSRSAGGQYQPPSPEQVLEFWLIAMKHDYRPPQRVPKHVEPDIDLSALMRSKRNHD